MATAGTRGGTHTDRQQDRRQHAAPHQVLTIGEPIGASGGTDTLKIVRVGDHPPPGTLE